MNVALVRLAGGGREQRWFIALLRCGGVLVAAIAASLLGPEMARAQKLSEDELSRSVWDTTYEAVGGGQVRAQVVFNGDSGYYTTSGGSRGSLYNVRYQMSDQVYGNGQVNADWSMGGTSGSVVFFVSGPGFSGSWQSGGRAGGWNGRFVSVMQPAGGGGGGGGGANFPGGGGGGGGGQVSYSDWGYNPAKDYYYRKCTFPAGGYQYVIFFKSKPDWVYWFNPAAKVYWCACPTVEHRKWGDAIRNGEDLFLMATKKSANIAECRFPDEGDDGANFTKGKAKDADGSMVDLGCPPPDLP